MSRLLFWLRLVLPVPLAWSRAAKMVSDTQREIARLAIAEELARFRQRGSTSRFPTRRSSSSSARHRSGARVRADTVAPHANAGSFVRMLLRSCSDPNGRVWVVLRSPADRESPEPRDANLGIATCQLPGVIAS